MAFHGAAAGLQDELLRNFHEAVRELKTKHYAAISSTMACGPDAQACIQPAAGVQGVYDFAAELGILGADDPSLQIGTPALQRTAACGASAQAAAEPRCALPGAADRRGGNAAEASGLVHGRCGGSATRTHGTCLRRRNCHALRRRTRAR